MHPDCADNACGYSPAVPFRRWVVNKTAARKAPAAAPKAKKAVAARKPVAAKKAAAKKPAAKKAAPVGAGRSAAAKLREKLSLTQPEFAKLLPASPRTVATLEQGTPPTETVARRLTELERLTTALGEVMKAESIGAWLKAPNTAFGGLKPLEVIDRGEGDRLWQMIYFLRSGVAS